MTRSMSVPAPRVCVLVAAASAVLAIPTMAQAVGDWRAVPAVTTPSSRTGFALAEMPNGDLLLFGGDEANPAATEWRWDGINWSPYTAQQVPRRDNPVMGKFGAHGLIVYGGNNGGSFLTDTWLSPDGIVWTQGTGAPGILTNASMAYDPSSDRMVMIGQTLQGQYATWFYDLGTGWAAGPSFTAPDARVVSDLVRGEALLLEGAFPTVAVSRLQGDNWQALGQSQQALSLGEVAFDARRGRVVLLQPFQSRETAEWDGLAFGATAMPIGRFLLAFGTAMSFHAARGETILVADYGNGIETYRHAADAAPNGTSFGQPCGNQPTLRLSQGSLPQPGTSHRLEASYVGSGLNLSVIGFSHTQTGSIPLPIVIPVGTLGCQLFVDPAVVTYLGMSQTPTQLVSVPNSVALLAERYNAQFVVFDALGVAGSSNGLELQIGQPLAEYALVETFLSDSNRDATVSSDQWQLGEAVPGALGGDGRHGSFSVDLGTEVAPGIYEIDAGSTLIPAANTLDGEAMLVTDGRFYFTDFTVPVGATIRFVGNVAPQIFVRGKANVMGKVSVDAPIMPAQAALSGLATGQLVSTFNAYLSLTGQPGGVGGPGGGRGGNGGNRCSNSGPIIVAGVDVTSGQPGESVRVAASHAYLAATAGTGGQGSLLMPPTGVWATPVPTIGPIYCGYFSPGGGGGGYATAGGVALTPVYQGVGTSTIAAGAIASGGIGFSVSPYPATPPTGYSSLEHFTVGGSGGGGGGSHGYGIVTLGTVVQRWMAGHGGSGGGGVLVIRSGSDLTVSGELSSRGGDGVLIRGTTGGNPPVYIGVSSPGGGGSGGSFLLQSATIAQVNGHLDASGGSGSRVDLIDNALQRVTAQAGNGASGDYRIEAPQLQVTGSHVPPYTASRSGPLQDRDTRSGSRSKWLLPASLGLPIYVRYELLVDIGGLPVLFSDDPAVSPLAADDPSGAVLLRLQGAQADALTGSAIPGTEGPWRIAAGVGDDSLNLDRAEAVRFDMVLNSSLGVIRVLDLRIIWR